MGLSWQQGPLSPGAIGGFLMPEPLPKTMFYAEPLRRRMRVRFGGSWIADSQDVLLLFEPGRYPIAYFRETDIAPGTLERSEHPTHHPEVGLTSWYTIRAGDKTAARAAWRHTDLPIYARELAGRVAFELVSVEPDIVSVQLDGVRRHLAPGQTVMPHGPDRDLDVPTKIGKQL